VWAPGYRRGDRAQKRVHRKEKGGFQVTKFANHYVNYIAILIAAAAWCIGDAATSQPVPGQIPPLHALLKSTATGPQPVEQIRPFDKEKRHGTFGRCREDRRSCDRRRGC
jgi:hypothetical protein